MPDVADSLVFIICIYEAAEKDTWYHLEVFDVDGMNGSNISLKFLLSFAIMIFNKAQNDERSE